MRLKSIEEEIGEKSYQMSYNDKRTIRNMQYQIEALQTKILGAKKDDTDKKDMNEKMYLWKCSVDMRIGG